jgi:ATP-dependent protease HslVU (ClpYQ) peptidase subunit
MIRPLLRKSGKPWPWNTIRDPRPADWGIGMTVCIAAHCFKSDNDECIICAADALVSTGDMSVDHGARKIQTIGIGWNAMFAGHDISYLTPIIRRVRDVLPFEKGTIDQVSQAFVAAYKEELRVKAETEVLTPLGYTFDEFKANGLAQLGAETFTRTLYDIQQHTIDLTFLVAGFDGATAHIFTVTSPGKLDYYSELGFWAIGSGQTHALGSIFNSSKTVRFIGRAGALYRVCEAKFNAENATGVGRSTTVSIIERDRPQRLIFSSEVEERKN